MPDDVVLTHEYLDQGYESSDLRRMARSGEVVRVRRGAYAEPLVGDADPRLEHLRLVRATARRCSVDAVVSHMSAAAVHDLPLWTNRLTHAHLTRDQSGGSKRRRYVEIHGVPLPPSEVTTVAGISVTTLARTVLDLSCVLPMRQAVPIGDAALRRGLTRAELDAQLAQAAGRTGVAAARRTIAFLDARSESPGESVSRVDLARIGVAPTELQYEVFDEDGRFVGRSDFAWPEHKTLGEYDGRSKYQGLRRPDQSPADVLWDEKAREDRLRDLGWQVVRWLWEDLQHPERLRERLLRAFARGARTR
jgi:hypothetical protein